MDTSKLIQTIDQFFTEQTLLILKNYLSVARFEDYKSPVDQVVYPYICADLPLPVVNEVVNRIGVQPNFLFMRRSPEGINAPHAVHCDNSMGAKSLMVYLQTKLSAGTAFMQHNKTGCISSPNDIGILDKVVADANNIKAWTEYAHIKMIENSSVIFDAHLMHMAKPHNGFGVGLSARTVLTAFYD